MATSALLIKEEEEHIKRILPLLLKKDVEFRREIYIILTETFPTREELKQILDELRIFRKEVNERFEAVGRRFEAVDRRFEAVDRRFETLIKEMNLRFEAVIKEMRSGFEVLGDRISRAELSAGRFTRRVGHRLEEAIAAALRIALQRRDIKSEDITLNKKLIDKEGLIGPKDREYEVDILFTDTEVVIFEVKSYLKKKEEVEWFNDKVKLAKKCLNIKKEITKVIIALEKEDELIEIADKLGIILG